jgi:hypothetical protein
MEIQVDKNGNIIRSGRPSIAQEDTGRVWAIYNPETGPYYGLYDQNFYPRCAKGQFYWPSTTFRRPAVSRGDLSSTGAMAYPSWNLTKIYS